MQRIVVFLISFVLCLVACQAIAESTLPETVTVQLNLTYRYDLTEAMLPMINALRTDGQAWIWSEDGQEKISVTGLEALTYDFGLEKLAMKRAAEIAVHYSSVRPDSTAWYTVYPSIPGGRRGENILGGPVSTEQAFEEWKEENRDYTGQSHRRNMLDRAFTHIGVGCVQVDSTVRQADGSNATSSIYFWVQSFTSYGTGEASHELEDKYQLIDASVDILKKDGLNDITPVPMILKLGAGRDARVPYIRCRTGNWGNADLYILNPAWTVHDRTVLQIDGNRVTGIRNGYTILTASNLTPVPLKVDVVVTADRQPTALADSRTAPEPNETSFVTATDASGNIYEGEAKDGVYNGHGKMMFVSGAVYEGEWKDGKRNGQGVYTWPNGDVYDGEWVSGAREGRGTLTWQDGARYEGGWKNSQYHGIGTMFFTNGNVYAGEWEDGKKQGTGTYSYVNGAVYEGHFQADRYSGQGKMTYPSGNVYEGEWKDGKRNGQGRMTDVDGTVKEGLWENDQWMNP